MSSPTVERSIEQLLRRLETSARGLSCREAELRLERYGSNEPSCPVRTGFLPSLAYLWGPIPWLMELSAGLAAAAGQWSVLAAVLALLAAQALLGFWKDRSFERTFGTSGTGAMSGVRVLRDGSWRVVSPSNLVPGDVIHLGPGSIIPADVRMLSGTGIVVQPSWPLSTHPARTVAAGEALRAGWVVERSEADAVVFATGRSSCAHLRGDTAASLTPVQRAFVRIGDHLAAAVLAAILPMVTVSVFRGEPVLDSFIYVLVLAAVAVPLSLPSVLSLILAAGARRLATEGVVASRRSSVENLAAVDTIVCDRDDVTLGRPTARDPIPVGSATATDVLQAALLCSQADGDPADRAITATAARRGVAGSNLVPHLLPLDPERRRREAAVSTETREVFRVTKGSPHVVLALAENAGQVEADVSRAVENCARRGCRAVGVARTDGEGRWLFLGLLPLHDPLRPDSRVAVARASRMGVAVKLITGDQTAIARETTADLGLGTEVVDAGASGPVDWDGRLAGWARVSPSDRPRIVAALQDEGHVVAVTGTTVEDRTALAAADCGIATVDAADAARVVSDLRLLRTGLPVLVASIERARGILELMSRYTIRRVAGGLGTVLFVIVSILAFGFYPLSAFMLALVAALDEAASLALVKDGSPRPRRPRASGRREVIGVAVVLALLTVFSSLGLYYVASEVYHLGQSRIQTLFYLYLSVTGPMGLLLVRSSGPLWSDAPSPALVASTAAIEITATLIAVFGLLMPPLGWGWAGVAWGGALLWLAIAVPVRAVSHRVAANGLLAAWHGPPDAHDGPSGGAGGNGTAA